MARWFWPRVSRLASFLMVIPVAALAIIVHVPAALAFPYRAEIGRTTVLSEVPIDQSIRQRLARADALTALSPIDAPGLSRQVVLTNGGWRWRLLALQTGSAFAFRRPFSDALIFNRSDVARDRVYNGAWLTGERTLSGTIAHEMTHMLVARHFGELSAIRFPTWKNEGYADYVAQESGVHAGDAARLRATHPHSRALIYYEGRRRVGAELARNGGSVDRLFAD